MTTPGPAEQTFPQFNVADPYRRCVESCTHDLARGVLVDELLGGDGPWPTINPLATATGLSAVRAALAESGHTNAIASATSRGPRAQVEDDEAEDS